MHPLSSALFFFFNDTATTEIYTLSLHDALPILGLVEIAPVLLLLDAGVVGHDLADLVLRHAVVDHFLVILVGEGPAPLDLGPLHAELGGQGFHLLDIPDAVGNNQEDERPHDGGDPFGGP